MDTLIKAIKQKYPSLNFKTSSSYYWSPETSEIFYIKNDKGNIAQWSLMHEIGHALLNHHAYDADYMLIRLELAAWEKAIEIGEQFNVKIDPEHIEDCLDTYRDWLYKRSICPSCSTKCLQQGDFKHYKCFNCHALWSVTPSRFCRTYRSAEKTQDNKVFA